ncbi:uL15m family ribosomal protein [Halocalculus aciditolerans]|uniref:Large ribosomal subunit protein uL15 n=1 Tax=Halocalculus aciditolerans TaxID=1383812 RepID=A0A830FGJ9_9EURY|nr:uL15m family ribosomal protein [Halocalculus aciditolerans]GGL50768.1 50S ribosomal protein L15 [Halocalculus aciditolerans]
MTSKKRRQRGSRTHGGGTHKNRRGAGHRGGRGRAGRDKHEFHNYEPLGKHGFTRPDKVQDDVAEISVQELDENAVLYVEDGSAEETDFGFRIDARDVVEDGHEVDVVKVLGDGQVRNQLEVTADAFSASAVELIEEEGGDAVLSERAETADENESEESEN